jgi:hypothetical protein
VNFPAQGEKSVGIIRVMKLIYQAIIRGDRIEWIGEKPDVATALRVEVMPADQTDSQDEAPSIDPRQLTPAQRVALIEQAIAETGGLKSIADPVQWQREQRVDRPLPGREP